MYEQREDSGIPADTFGNDPPEPAASRILLLQGRHSGAPPNDQFVSCFFPEVFRYLVGIVTSWQSARLEPKELKRLQPASQALVHTPYRSRRPGKTFSTWRRFEPYRSRAIPPALGRPGSLE